MNILMVVTVFFPSPIYGGPATVAMNQAKALVKKGHKVTVISSNINSLSPLTFIEQKKIEIDEVEILYFSSEIIKPKFPYIYSKSMIEWLKQNVRLYDAIHIHYAREIIPCTAASIARKAKVPLFIQPHGMLNRRDTIRKTIDQLFVKKTLKSAAAVFVLQEHEESVISDISATSKRYILPNGIEVSSGIKHWVPDNIKNKTILFLARLHPRKRVYTFIEMAKILKDRGLDLIYRIVGPDGGDLQLAEQLVKKNNMVNEIMFVGPVNSAQSMLEFSNASIYVLPSDREPFAMTVLEALSLGVPTIATRGLQNHKLLESYNAIKIVDRDAESLANGVEELINNYDECNQLSFNGRKLIQDRLSIQKVAEELEDVYVGVRNYG